MEHDVPSKIQCDLQLQIEKKGKKSVGAFNCFPYFFIWLVGVCTTHICKKEWQATGKQLALPFEINVKIGS